MTELLAVCLVNMHTDTCSYTQRVLAHTDFF